MSLAELSCSTASNDRKWKFSSHAETQKKNNYDPSRVCWSYGHCKADGSVSEGGKTWFVTSSSFLEVIYRPRREAFQFYTNRTRTIGGKAISAATCGGRLNGNYRKQNEDFFADNSALPGKSDLQSQAKLRYSGLQKEMYTQRDVVNIEYIDNIDIGKPETSTKSKLADASISLETAWKGVKIYLKVHERHLAGHQTVSKEAKHLSTSVDHHAVDTEEIGERKGGSILGKEGISTGSDSGGSEESGVELGEKQASTTPLLQKGAKGSYSGGQKNGNKVPGNDIIVVTFALPVWHEGPIGSNPRPSLLWKVDFPLDPSISLEHFTVLNGSVTHALEPKYATDKNPSHIYINGWQSWSFTGSVARGDPQPGSAMPDYLSRAFNHGGSCPRKVSASRTWLRKEKGSNELVRLGKGYNILSSAPQYYKSDMYTALSYNELFHTGREDHMLDENNSSCIILGWISQRKQFGMIGVNDDMSKVAMHCSCDGVVANVQTPLPTNQFQNRQGSASEDDSSNVRKRIETDWAWCQIIQSSEESNSEEAYDFQDEPLAAYIDFTAQYNGARHHLREPVSTGWCSWYHYYENLDESTLIANFDTLEKLNARGVGFNMCMCDDGYMTAWGDWDSIKPPDKFPSQQKAMNKIAQGMDNRGMRPGVWLAPFAADKHSTLTKKHPEWIIRNDAGVAANSSNCGKFFYGLDATNPAVRDHARKTIERAVNEWGYTVLKLDFLYASCLEGNGKYDLSMVRILYRFFTSPILLGYYSLLPFSSSL
jgi:hypothetical protein